jgi:(p)ppGpp synthase/HD superfamily hydrolase
MTSSPRPLLTERYGKAVEHARHLHRDDVRKGTTIPYLSHLLSVSALVLEHGGIEDQAIAALLHDAAEDHGGAAVISDLRHMFGDVVADIVEACSDSLVEDSTNKPPWLERKQAYLAHVAHMPQDAVLVSAADKLHNARCILADYRRLGDALFGRFNPAAGRTGTCWYYTSLAATLTARLAGLGDDAVALGCELQRTVDALLDEVRVTTPDIDQDVADFVR